MLRLPSMIAGRRRFLELSSLLTLTHAVTASRFKASALAAEGRPPLSALEVTAVSEKDVYRQLEPIVIDLTVKNTSDENISRVISNSDNIYISYELIVHAFHSQPVPWTKFRLALGLPFRSKSVDLRPGESLREMIVANLAFDMTALGAYSIIVEVPYRLKKEQSGERYGPSNPVVVEVSGFPLDRKKDVRPPLEDPKQRSL
jgi:hypothetical protein